MKKVLMYIFILLIILFVIPSVFTRKRESKAVEEKAETKEEESIKEYDYSKYANIKLYHAKTGEIEELPIDNYLYGVVSGEMPADYELEALKAQAVVARTYTLYQIINSNGKHGEADICDDSTCCQAWISKEDRLNRWDDDKKDSNWEKITKAVDLTQGEIITYNNAPIDAFFHSNSGGITETATNVWGGTNFPYLKSVETAGEDNYSSYNSEVELSKNELIEKIKEKHPDVEIDFNSENPIQITEYTESGRARTVKFGNLNISGTETRSLLGLKSTNFKIEITDETVKFIVIGYGHGVGMSQTGADSLAKNGSNYKDIINHFYKDVQITEVNNL